MVAMKKSVSYAFNPESPYTATAEDQAMTRTVSRGLTSSMRAQRKSKQQIIPYTGPHIAGYSIDKLTQRVMSNDAHSASTNDGFKRKDSGGFFFH